MVIINSSTDPWRGENRSRWTRLSSRNHKWLIDVQDVSKITHKYLIIQRICLTLIKKTRMMSTCKPIGLGNISTDCVQESPRTLSHIHSHSIDRPISQSINRSMRNQMPRNVSLGQLHELLIAMSWASLHCPDETDFLPSFLPSVPSLWWETTWRRSRRRVKVVLVRVNACGWFALWKLAKQGYSLQIALPQNHREARVGGDWGRQSDKKKPPPNESRANLHQDRRA